MKLKFLLIIIFSQLFISSTWAQKKLPKLEDYILDDSTQGFFMGDSIPEAWKKESIIITGHREVLALDVAKKKIYATYYLRTRYKLQDHAAIEFFSSFEVPALIKQINIIHEDGTIDSISKFTQIQETGVLSRYEQFYIRKDRYYNYEFSLDNKKIAINGLRVGDEIEFVFYSAAYQSTRTRGLGPLIVQLIMMSNPYTALGTAPAITNYLHRRNSNAFIELNNTYIYAKSIFNTVFKSVEFRIDKNLNVNLGSGNGSAKFEKVKSSKRKGLFENEEDKAKSKNSKGKKKKKKKKKAKDNYKYYSLDFAYEEKYKKEIFSNRIYNEPYNYIRIYTAKRTNSKYFKAFEFNKGQGKDLDTLTKNDIVEHFYYNKLLFTKDRVHEFYEYMAKKGKKTQNPYKLAMGYAKYLKEETKSRYAKLYSDNVYIDSEDLIYGLLHICQDFNLPYSFYYVLPNNKGSLEGTVSASNFEYAIEVDFPEGKEMFFTTPFYEPEMVAPPSFNGAEAYKISFDPRSKKKAKKVTSAFELEVVNFPVLEPELNKESHIYVVKINPETKLAQVSEFSSYFGYERQQYFENDEVRLLLFEDSEKKKKRGTIIGAELPRELYNGKISFGRSWKRERIRLKKALQERINKLVREENIEDIKSKYNIEKVDTFIIDPNSYLEDGLEVKTSAVFDVKGLIGQADESLIFSIGEIVPNLGELSEEQKNTRNSGVILPYLKSFEYQIEIEIPQGYKKPDISNLNKNIQNIAGSFTSTAKIENNKIIISINQSFKLIKTNAENWPAYVQIFNALTYFNYQKIVFIK